MERKQITKVCKNCDICGLPEITCICNKINSIESRAKFIILSNEREIYRNTNTARIFKLVNSKSTEIVVWKRGEKHIEIFQYINNDKYEVFLVFPAINEELKSRKVKFNKNNKITVFIIVDGTWNEAWKIIRKSEYLRELPVISLETKKISKFILRRGQEEANLCTVEIAIELLKLNREMEFSDMVDKYFELFLASYKCGLSGHSI